MNEPSRSSDFITVGEKECRVTVELSNGYKVIREKHREGIKEKGKKKEDKINRYIVINPDGTPLWEEGEEANKFNHEKVPQEVKQILKINVLKYDSDNEINFNFLEQIKPCFFLDEKATAKAKIMGMFFGTHYIDEDIRRLTSKEKELNKELKSKEKDIEKLNKSLEEFKYIDDIKDKINITKKMLKRKVELEKEIDDLNNIQNEFKDLIDNISENEKKIQCFKNVDTNIISMKDISFTLNLTIDLIEYIKDVNLLKHNIEKNIEIIKHKKLVTILNEKVNSLSISNIKELIYIRNEYAETNNSLLSNEKAINITNNIQNLDLEYKNISQKTNNILELTKIEDEYNTLNKLINSNINIINYKNDINLIEEKIILSNNHKDDYFLLKNSIDEYKNILNELRSLEKAIKLTNAVNENSSINLEIKTRINDIELILSDAMQYNKIT
ncbi:MAG: hypothetical protein IJH34_04595, partial [Romboutsia sp.]|nr:hypothetical protein [Romboutsia sp.]